MRLLLVVSLLVCSLLVSAQEPVGVPQSAHQQLNAGAAAFRNAHYEDALAHFQQAVDMAPQFTTARLYLAITHGQMYIPGVDTPENVVHAETAIREFQRVVDSPDATPEHRLHALKGIASLNFNMKRLEEAAEWYQKVTEADAADAEAYYSIGVIRWTQAYQPRMEVRIKLKLSPTDSLPPGPECSALRATNQTRVEEGMRQIKKALELRPDYDDAMAYLNLIYRERADYECDYPKARAADLKAADHWVDRTMAVKKATAERGGSGLEGQSGKPSGGGGGYGTSDRPPHLR